MVDHRKYQETDALLQMETPLALASPTEGKGAVPGLTVLAHPRVDHVGRVAPLTALLLGDAAQLSRSEPLFREVGSAQGRPLADPGVSRKPLTLTPRDEGLAIAPHPAGRGRVKLAGRPLTESTVVPWPALDDGVVIELSVSTAVLLHAQSPLSAATPAYGLIGDSLAMRALREDIKRVADLGVAVLLRGESGSGKELVARALHDYSNRRTESFIAINMAAIPASMAASELFGHTRGAFTGAATARRGHFHNADRGTLFLDEIGDTPEEVQLSLLRALETSEVQPLGASRPERVDVRFVAATDADLDAAVASGAFRQALLQRLAGYQIRVPPLRERRDDIGRLLVHFLKEELARTGESRRLEPRGPGEMPWLPASLVAHLASHSWPGNVRQLRNVVRQLAIANRGKEHATLDPRVLAMLATDGSGAARRRVESSMSLPAVAPPGAEPRRRPADLSEDDVVDALRLNAFKLGPTAKSLGISRTSLFALIEASDRIRRPKDITAEQIEAAQAGLDAPADLAAVAAVLEISERGLKLRMKELGLR